MSDPVVPTTSQSASVDSVGVEAPHRSAPRALQVQTAVGSRQDADRIADDLVARRLAACVQVLAPMTSTYRWRGEVERAEEWLLLAKTTPAAYPAVEAAIRALHPYDEPEIVALPIVAGSVGYVAWIEAEVDR